jgi:uncharacterized protein (TIGR00251 family)
VVSFSGGVLKVRVMEPADGGRANAALLKFFAKKFGMKSVSIANGSRSRDKLVDFGNDLSADEAIAILCGGISQTNGN